MAAAGWPLPGAEIAQVLHYIMDTFPIVRRKDEAAHWSSPAITDSGCLGAQADDRGGSGSG